MFSCNYAVMNQKLKSNDDETVWRPVFRIVVYDLYLLKAPTLKSEENKSAYEKEFLSLHVFFHIPDLLMMSKEKWIQKNRKLKANVFI